MTWTETEKTWDYAPFEVSMEPQAANSSSMVSSPRLLSEIVDQDGHSLTTTYPDAMYDGLNFPKLINRPGNVTEEFEYQHVKSGTGGANPKYILGLRESETVSIAGSIVKKTTQDYPNTGAIVPSYARFYHTENNYLQVDNEYYWTNGYAGSLRSISYGGYSESYEYENGVVKKLEYPGGPNIERIINRNGTIKEETRNGVKKSFTWDNDFRLTLVQAPDTDNAVIDYDDRNNIVTLTQGSSEIKLTHDEWGRLIERKEKVEGSQYAVHTYSNFDAFDRPMQEITRTGATYSLAYDVHGRLRSRSAPGDEHEYAYVTSDGSVKTTETLNGSVVIEREVDHFGRILMGSTNGNQVNYSYTSVSDGIEQTITFSQGQAQRTIVQNFLNNKVSETHPETGSINYEYTPELWLKRVTRPGMDYTFMHDGRGRVKEMKLTGGATVSTRDYDPTFGFISQTEHNGVIVGYSDPDRAGRPQKIKLSVPRPLPTPHVTHPLGYLDPASLFKDAFIWEAVKDADGNLADSYDFELWEGAWSPLVAPPGSNQYPPRLLYRGEIRDIKIPFSDIAFIPAGDQWYWFRVRAKKANGEIGPFCRPHSFVVGTPFTVSEKLGAIPIKPEGLPPEVDQLPRPETGDDAVDPIGDEDIFIPPRPQPTTSYAVFVLELEYDGLGRVSGVKHPDEDLTGIIGNWQKYGFNNQASHKRVEYGGNPIVSDTSYWDSGLSSKMQMLMLDSRFSQIGSFEVDRSYDSLGRIKSHSVKMNEESVIYSASQIEYYDDGYGHIKSLTRNDPGLQSTVGYTYDPRGLLETLTIGSAVNTYVYDNAGNLTDRTGLSVLGLTATDINNNPVPASLYLSAFSGVSYNNANQRIGWGYDLDGRLILDDQWGYIYTYLDQIAGVLDPVAGWSKAHYLYDADGNRVREVHGHQVVYSIRLPNGQLISQETQFQSYDWTGVKHDFVYHNSIPIAQIRYGKNIEYEFRDRLGNPVVAIQWPWVKYYEYAPYGHQMRTEIIYNLMELEFASHERDRYTERDYMMARYYDSFAGRFNRPDPAFDFDETNLMSFYLYSYALGNPVSFVDPDGRVPVPVITGAIGAGAGFVGSVVGQSISKGFNNVDWGDAFIAGGSGAVAGALAPFVATKLTGAVLLGSSANIAQYIVTQLSNDELITLEGIAINAGTGALAGLTGGAFSKPSGILFETSSIHATSTFRAIGNQLNREAAIKANAGVSNFVRSALAGITSNTDPRDLPKLIPNLTSGLSPAEKASLLEHGRGLIH